jgi:hypothetical protein
LKWRLPRRSLKTSLKKNLPRKKTLFFIYLHLLKLSGETMTCYICKNVCKISNDPSGADKKDVECSRCGRYKITGDAEVSVEHYEEWTDQEQQRANISGYLT